MALPVNGSTQLIPAYYSFYRPRKDERLSWPSWVTCSGWLTYISCHLSAAGRAQDRESSPARDRRSTTVLRHQLVTARVRIIRGVRVKDLVEESAVWKRQKSCIGKSHSFCSDKRSPPPSRRTMPLGDKLYCVGECELIRSA